MDEFTHTINGCAETSNAYFDVIDPAAGVAFKRCPDASREQLDRAVEAARNAFGGGARSHAPSVAAIFNVSAMP